MVRGNEFRKDFSKLDTLRHVLGTRVPFGACTAIATPEKLKLIRSGLGIKPDAVSIIEGTNRPNLFMAVREITGPDNGMLDLEFLIPKSGEAFNIKDIPPTIIYVDHR